MSTIADDSIFTSAERLAEYCWNGTVWNLEFDETVPLSCSTHIPVKRGPWLFFWAKKSRWGFQPYSANLSSATILCLPSQGRLPAAGVGQKELDHLERAPAATLHRGPIMMHLSLSLSISLSIYLSLSLYIYIYVIYVYIYIYTHTTQRMCNARHDRPRHDMTWHLVTRCKVV